MAGAGCRLAKPGIARRLRQQRHRRSTADGSSGRLSDRGDLHRRCVAVRPAHGASARTASRHGCGRRKAARFRSRSVAAASAASASSTRRRRRRSSRPSCSPGCVRTAMSKSSSPREAAITARTCFAPSAATSSTVDGTVRLGERRTLTGTNVVDSRRSVVRGLPDRCGSCRPRLGSDRAQRHGEPAAHRPADDADRDGRGHQLRERAGRRRREGRRPHGAGIGACAASRFLHREHRR